MRSRIAIFLWSLLVATTLLGTAPRAARPASPTVPPKTNIYDVDPQHLWNRLYAALYVRTSKDGHAYGQDELDPLLWPSSKYLLTEPRYPQVLALLDEFLAKRGERLIRDALKRALFQRDLWAVFDWLADPHPEYHRGTAHLLKERRELRNRLAPIIRRLALSAKQIESLPDNYAAAVAAKAFPPKHDPSRAEAAFLPPDLFRSQGPWVLLSQRGGSTAAPQHLEFVRGRSAFLVFINLPKGRKATLDYLEKLRSFPAPTTQPADRSGRYFLKFGPFLNPNLPQFPAGTQFALVRQMMLLEDTGEIRPTKLIEMVQLRFFRTVPKKEDLPPEKRRLYGFTFVNVKDDQDFYEFRFHRKDLFGGRAGGLHAVRSDERVFSLFSVQDEDVFERRPEDLAREARERAVPRGPRAPATQNLQKAFGCAACHGQGPGIHSVLSFRRDPPPDLVESSRRTEEEVVRHWKHEHYSWGLLQGLTDKPIRPEQGIRQPSGPPVHATATDTTASAQQIVRDALAKFVKHRQQSTTGPAEKHNLKLQMECLVKLMKIGPAAVPVLIDCLKNEKAPASTRAFAARTLGYFGDPRAQDVLLKAIEDKDGTVAADSRFALGRLGRLKATPKLRQLAGTDPDGSRYFDAMFIMTRDDEPNPEPIRKALRNYDLARMDSAQLGKPAPDFTLPDSSGKVWHLRQFRGKKVVVLIRLVGIN